MTAGSVSRLHRLTGDELWVYQGGLPLELTMISPRGGLEVRVLGEPWESARGRATADAPADAHPVGRKDLALVPPRDDRRAWLPQALVPAGSWQGARLAGGPHLPADRAWALVSCVVTPGFDFADFELGDREALLAAFPQHADLVRALT